MWVEECLGCVDDIALFWFVSQTAVASEYSSSAKSNVTVRFSRHYLFGRFGRLRLHSDFMFAQFVLFYFLKNNNCGVNIW